MSPFMANEMARIHSAELADAAARYRRVSAGKNGASHKSRRRWLGRKPADPRRVTRD